MATGSRTLKLAILAETKQLTSNLKSAEKDVQGFGDKMGDIGKKVGLAFAAAAAAAGAYAIKIGIDGVKSAIEDEAAQLRLANALKTATGATDDQIKATEDYISKTQLATGVADNDLRNAFQRLSVTTKDVNSSQKLLNLALDISKGTGKDLATVTEALAKSYEGQDAKLAKLGIGLSAADLKAMDFTQTQVALSNLYGGAASRNAETFQGRIDRLKQGFDEAKESVGTALLPIIERFIGYLFQYGVPIVNKFKDGWETVKTAIDNNRENFQAFIDLMQDYVLPILGKVFGFIVDVGAKAAAAIITAFGTIAGAITPVLNFIIDSINTVIRGINLVSPFSDISYINKIGQFVGTPFGQAGSGAANTPGGSTVAGTPTPTFTPAAGGAGSQMKLPSSVLVMPKVGAPINTLGTADVRGREYAGSPITVNIGVAGDPEATARVIVDSLNNSFYRGTRGAGLLEGIA